jgi:tRNA 2-thiouridine synthesizing protein D
MARFVLQLQSASVGTPVIAELIRFATATISLQHSIDHIFVYGDAVYGLLANQDVPVDEINWSLRLVEFAQSHTIPILYCATAAEKRGVTHTIEGVELAGLAELAMRLDQVDQWVMF